MFLFSVFLSPCGEEVKPLLNRLDSPADMVILSDTCAELDVTMRTGHYYAFVTNSTQDAVRVVDITEREFLLEPKIGVFPLSVKTGSYPRSIETTSDGCYLLVGNVLSQDLSVISVADILKTRFGTAEISSEVVELSGEPVDVVVGPGEGLIGAEVYVSVTNLPGIDMLKKPESEGGSVAFEKITLSLEASPGRIALSDDGSTLFIAVSEEGKSAVLALDTTSLELREIEVGDPQTSVHIVSVAETETEQYLYALKPRTSSIAVVDISVKEEEQWLNVNQNGHPPCSEHSTECDILLPCMPRDIAFYRFEEGAEKIKIYKKDGTLYEYPSENIGFVTCTDGRILLIDPRKGHHHLIDGDAESVGIKGPELLLEGELVEIDPSVHPVFSPCEPEALDGGMSLDGGGEGEPEIGFCENGIKVINIPETSETWKISAEGVLPNTTSSFGEFQSDKSYFVDKTVNFQNLGISSGDILEIIEERFSEDGGFVSQECPLRYRIASFSDDTLILETPPLEGCFDENEYLHYWIRAGSSFTVEGSLSGFYKERAYINTLYRNPFLSFTLLYGEAMPDGGMEMPDAGMEAHDAGIEANDAGMEAHDAGTAFSFLEEELAYRFEIIPNLSWVSIEIGGMPSRIKNFHQNLFVILEGAEALVKITPPNFDTREFTYYR